jgi:rhodanese-related sulfurtransferase
MSFPPRNSAILQSFILLIASALCAALAQAIRPNPLPWKQSWSDFVAQGSAELGIPILTVDEARRMVEGGTHLVLDARPAADFHAGHLSGAFSVPSEEIEKYIPAVMPLLTPDLPIMTYCSGLQCDESLKLSRYLLNNGFTNVALFAGGLSEWTAAGLPVQK